MDALQQHPLRFTRPPMSDSHHPHPQQQHPPPHGPWFSGQFQFQPSPPPHYPHSHHPPPPQWLSHSSDQSMPPFSHPAPPPAPPSYSSSTSMPPPYPPYHHFPPSHRPPAPPPPPLQSQLYGQSDQRWGNPNWARHQGWEYPDNNIPHSNEDDWAAKARAWAASNAARENQNTQLQFAPVGRMEEQNHVYQDHYQQAVEPYFTDVHQSSLPPSSHHQQPLPDSMADTQMPLGSHLRETASFSAGPLSYVPEGSSYGGKDGSLAPDANPVPGLPQGSTHMRSSGYQQEVPSSYSSFPGNNEEAGNAEAQSHMPLLSSISSVQGQLHPQHSLPTGARSVSLDQSHFVYGDHSAGAAIDASDQPLHFEHGSAHDHGTQHLTGYAHPDHPVPIGGLDHVTAVTSVHSWTPPVAPGVAFPPIPPVPSGPQFDPPFLPPHPLPGHPTPMFGRMPGSTFGPNIPPVSAPFGIGAGTALHPAAVFPGDANGGFSISERPKKASVPNWLKEELIKKKASVIASNSVQDHPSEVPFDSSGAESADNFYRKVDHQADSKSADSSRSTEDEDDDEDDAEAAKSAAINQEIKRVLTEVLLKVTDELFEEIASKVLAEDDLTVEVDHSIVPAGHELSPLPPAVPAVKASAKVLIPVKTKDDKNDDASGNTASGFPGDVLGLGNYASDDDEVQSSSMFLAKQRDGAEAQKLSGDRVKDNLSHTVEKGMSLSEIEETGGGLKGSEIDANTCGRNEALQNRRPLDDVARVMTRKASPTNDIEFDNPGIESGPADVKVVPSTMNEVKVSIGIGRKEELSQGYANVVLEEIPNPTDTDANVENTTDDSQDRHARKRSNKNGHKSKKSDPISKNVGKDTEDGKAKADHKHLSSGDLRRRENRDVNKEKADERNRMKDGVKDRGDKPGEKLRSSDSRKSSNPSNVREDKKEAEKARRGGTKEDSNRKRDRVKDEKEDRSKHRDSRDSHRYKRQRSSSASSRGKNGKDNISGSLTSGSSDEASENSRHRKRQSRRRGLSPSPVRSRRRQVSRSPHAKNSQRRHSPYSSLESRGRRSRSVSPVRRRR